MPTTPAFTPAQRVRVLAIAGALPVVIVGAGIALMYSWAAELPDPIAIHWGAGDAPDGFGSLATVALLIGSIVSVFAIATAIAVSRQHAARENGSRSRLLVATSVWLATFLTVGIVGTVYIQRGLTDAAETGSPAMPLLAGLAAAVPLSLCAWFAAPRPAELAAAQAGPDPAIELGNHERVVWTRAANAGVIAYVTVGVGLLVAIGGAVVLATTQGAGYLALAGPMVVLAVVLTSLFWRVRVDAHTVTVRSIAGFPRFRYPIDRLESAASVRVNAFGEFGGWGIRFGSGGRLGIILRTGEALELRRADGRITVVTVADSATAAALVNGLIARSAAHSPR